MLPLALLANLAALLPAIGNAADLTVELHGVRVQTGMLRLAVVDGQAGWDGKAKPAASREQRPSHDTAKFTFAGLAPGVYAVMVTHDENGNGILDTNLVGLPTEGYGFSNNPRVMRKPTWDEARFLLDAAGTTIRIELR